MATPLHDRADWGALKRLATPAPINNEGQTVHYWGESPWPPATDRSTPDKFRESAAHAACASILRAGQKFHMTPVGSGGRGWNDLAYNSAVCPHGHRYEGRGVGVRSGANGTNTGNSRSCATVYLAGEGDPLTEEAKAAFLDEGIRFGHGLRWNHADWKSTACAGDPVRAWQHQGFNAPEHLPTNDGEGQDHVGPGDPVYEWVKGLQEQLTSEASLPKLNDMKNVPGLVREFRTEIDKEVNRIGLLAKAAADESARAAAAVDKLAGQMTGVLEFLQKTFGGGDVPTPPDGS